MSQKSENQVEKARVATNFMFLVCGLSYSSWAPMVPYVKARLELGEAALGLILLAFGIGALIAMPITGWAVHRYGSCKISTIAALCMIILLPILAIAPSGFWLSVLLFAFGSSGGALNVSMNSQASAVETHICKPVISGFHSLFSLGGLLGAGIMSLLLERGVTLFYSTLGLVMGMAIILLLNCRQLLPSHMDIRVTAKQEFSMPPGRVFLYGAVCFILFLAEGSMLDWGAILLRSNHGYDVSVAGIGYAIFSVAMAIGRFSGNRLIMLFGSASLVRAGGFLAAAGFFLSVYGGFPYSELIGFLLIGFGAANIVPIMFGAAGRMTDISASFALTIVITMGYTGMLLGPAFIGLLAEATTLPIALGSIAVLLVGVAFCASKVSAQQIEVCQV